MFARDKMVSMELVTLPRSARLREDLHLELVPQGLESVALSH